MRFKTRVVYIGDIPLGGSNPVRIQSMTSTDTMDTKATVEQSIRMIEAGCEYVRITAPSVQAAENLRNIKKKLRVAGYGTPLIADIHFNPKVAEIAARIVEKVRINPGNYVDRKSGKPIPESEYDLELERISERLYPLLKICLDHGTTIRIGVNHGSLSERTLNRYGNTPEGMVESALEFARICSGNNFHNLVLSLKSSNTRVMIEANRLLVKSMLKENMNYPVHLGVTEAGDAEDGRIKSAAGIGTLLKDGIGDTIRVSLTEDPEFEIPVAKLIIGYREGKKQAKEIKQYHLKNYKSLKHPLVISSAEDEKADLIVTDAQAKDEGSYFFVPIEGEARKGTLNNPVINKAEYKNIEYEDFLINTSIDYADDLLRGHCQGIWIDTDKSITSDLAVQTAFDILQATGLRISKTEFIACPSCGRTLFNIQEVLAKVKERTEHLKGLKIAVMGCIVNGPGEMADAHYGYVGAAKGMVNLYKGKQVRKRNVPEEHALDELVALIKECGDWRE